MKKLVLIYCLSICIINAIYAQQTPLWSKKIASGWQRITSLGYLVVGSTGRLSALDPETGNVLWEKSDLGTVQEQMVEEIWGTSLIKVAYGNEPDEDALPMITIIDVITGKTVFDSNIENLGVLGSYTLDRSGNFLVVGVEPGKLSAKLLMYSLATGEKLWSNEDIFKAETGGKGVLGKMAAAVKTVLNMQGLIAPPLELDDQSVLIVHPSYVIRLKSTDGAITWKSTIEESVNASIVFSPYQTNSVFVGTMRESAASFSPSTNGTAEKSYFTTYYAFDLNNGQTLWKTKPIGENLNQTIALENGLLVFYRANPKATITLLDYKTGTGLWGKGKGLKVQGSVVGYIQSEAGLVLSSGGESAFSNRGEEYFLNVLDSKTGTLRFDKSVKVKGNLVSTELTSKGILFTTTREVNILDPASGNFVLPASIESGAPRRDVWRPFPTGNTNEKLYVFAPKDGSLIELDKNAGTTRKINAGPIEFGGKEFPKAIDVFEEGIALTSEQNVMMIGFDGKLKHVKYYQPPAQSGWVRAMALAEVIKGVYVGVLMVAASATMSDAAVSVDNNQLKSQAQGAAVGLGTASAFAFSYAGRALQEFNRRVKATTSTDEYVLLLTEPVKKDIKLIQVDKRTGEILATMSIGKDREPQYSVDFIDRKVYYVSGSLLNDEISCFQLK
jgi:outer membrane protein assembly factor BamB